MRIRSLAACCVVLVIAGAAGPLFAQSEKTTWDNLQLVKSSRSARLYLMPGADFRPYKKFMMDPVEVAAGAERWHGTLVGPAVRR